MFNANQDVNFVRTVSVKNEKDGALVKAAFQPTGFDDSNIAVKIRWKGQACTVDLEISSAPLEHPGVDTVLAAKSFAVAMGFAIQLAEEARKQFREGVDFIQMTLELLSLDLPKYFNAPFHPSKFGHSQVIRIGLHYSAMGFIWQGVEQAAEYVTGHCPDLPWSLRDATEVEFNYWRFVIEHVPEAVNSITFKGGV